MAKRPTPTGIHDSIYFKVGTEASANDTTPELVGYLLASPSSRNDYNNASSAEWVCAVKEIGHVHAWQNYNAGYEVVLRPLVALKSTVSAEYDNMTGLWTLSN